MSSEDETIYDRIGGEETIGKLVDSFYTKVLADPELKSYFKHAPLDKLNRMQRAFFAAATGGPIVYSGRPLSHVHKPLGISRREFQRFTEHLIETLQEIGVGESDINKVIAYVNMYADEITTDSEFAG